MQFSDLEKPNHISICTNTSFNYWPFI